MKVHELITELKKYDPSWDVHLDVSNSDNGNWEGDRVVRTLAGVREQEGYRAVALDGFNYDDMEAARQQRACLDL